MSTNRCSFSHVGVQFLGQIFFPIAIMSHYLSCYNLGLLGHIDRERRDLRSSKRRLGDFLVRCHTSPKCVHILPATSSSVDPSLFSATVHLSKGQWISVTKSLDADQCLAKGHMLEETYVCMCSCLLVSSLMVCIQSHVICHLLHRTSRYCTRVDMILQQLRCWFQYGKIGRRQCKAMHTSNHFYLAAVLGMHNPKSLCQKNTASQ